MRIGTEYEYFPEFGSICLMDLKLPELPPRIKVTGGPLFRKSEFHITLVTARRLAPLIDEQNETDIEAKIIEEFKAFVRKRPLTKYELLDGLRLIKRGDRRTIIVRATVAHLDEFFDVLRHKFGVDLPLQPAHITLYTMPSDPGIGLLSDEELARDSEPVDLPELQVQLRGKT